MFDAVPKLQLRARAGVRWWVYAAPAALIPLAATAWAAHALPPMGVLAPVVLALAFVHAALLALTGWPMALGAVLGGGRPGGELAPPRADARRRTAVCMTIHNEDSSRVFAAIRVMRDSLRSAHADNIDLWVLSDTRDPDIAAAEAREAACLPAHAEGPRILYRRRLRNTGRKAGNIADFCAEHGTAYDYMVVLDADSLMSAAAVQHLIGLMNANAGAGLIQTMCYAVNRETLFARMTQFSMRLYGAAWADGAAIWHRGGANYWGHNAIIRIRPFLEHAELPVLPGAAPMGGEILCHDVVEAALLTRAGWGVHLVPEIPGSFEEVPANIADFAARERRWCQGNLQHARVLAMPGLPASARLHLGIGVLFYLTAPLWLVLAALLTMLPAACATAVAWPLLTVALVPKLLVAARALADGRTAQKFGGRAALLGSIVAEELFATLTTATALLQSSVFVVTTLLGHVVAWDAQARDDRGVGFAEAWRRTRTMTVLGLSWGAVLLACGDATLAWGAPLAAGLALSVPTLVFSSRLKLGRGARALGLFCTEDELDPENILRAQRKATICALQENAPGPPVYAAALS